MQCNCIDRPEQKCKIINDRLYGPEVLPPVAMDITPDTYPEEQEGMEDDIQTQISLEEDDWEETVRRFFDGSGDSIALGF